MNTTPTKNPRLALARRRAGIHPGYVRAVESKIQTPAEIYAYPAKARIEAALKWRPLKVPAMPVSSTTTPALSIGWSRTAYAVVLLALWAVLANVNPGV